MASELDVPGPEHEGRHGIVRCIIAHRLGDVEVAEAVLERDAGEGGLRDAAAHVEPRRGWFVGGTARYRDALGSTKEAIVRDGFAGPTTTLTVGAFALSLNAGVAMAETRMSPRAYGPAGTLSLGAAF